MKFEFDYGKPFTPFQQLMGVLPVDSMDHVPLAYRVSGFRIVNRCFSDFFDRTSCMRKPPRSSTFIPVTLNWI